MKRDRRLEIRLTEEEEDFIHKKMEVCGISNASAYLRKMGLDGYIVQLDVTPIEEVARLLSKISSNVNQIAKRSHAMGEIYAPYLEDLREGYERVTEEMATLSRRFVAL